MAELWFYHLERARVEDALPELLGKLLARDGRALVVSPEDDRLAALDRHLWTFREDSFLPHGIVGEAQTEDQPVLLATAPDNLNRATMLFCLDGADPGDVSAFDRVVVLFEASDETATARARALWSVHKKSDILISYWKQDEAGRWRKQA